MCGLRDTEAGYGSSYGCTITFMSRGDLYAGPARSDGLRCDAAPWGSIDASRSRSTSDRASPPGDAPFMKAPAGGRFALHRPRRMRGPRRDLRGATHKVDVVVYIERLPSGGDNRPRVAPGLPRIFRGESTRGRLRGRLRKPYRGVRIVVSLFAIVGVFVAKSRTSY